LNHMSHTSGHAPASLTELTPRILIADGNAQDRALLSGFFHRRGHAVHTVECGTDALEIAPLFRPHVVFIDLQTPKFDGWEVCEKLSDNDNVEGAAIFALTTNSPNEYTSRCRDAHFDAYLSKPVELDLADRLVYCSVTRLVPDRNENL
jgi:adenylate cyclase